MQLPPTILKFGASVLRGEKDLFRVASEIYRYHRRAQPVIAVVAAFQGTTDALISEALADGLSAESAAYAAHVASGDYEAALALLDQLDAVGLSADLHTPLEMSLTARGPRQRAVPVLVDTYRIRMALSRTPILIVPGFSAIDEHGRMVLLGRGGADMTAVFLASALKVNCARLIQDANGLYERMPSDRNRLARFPQISWHDAAKLEMDAPQEAALASAAASNVELEIAKIGQVGGTLIGKTTADPVPVVKKRPLRIAIIGGGTLQHEVLARLQYEPSRYSIARVLT